MPESYPPCKNSLPLLPTVVGMYLFHCIATAVVHLSRLRRADDETLRLEMDADRARAELSLRRDELDASLTRPCAAHWNKKRKASHCFITLTPGALGAERLRRSGWTGLGQAGPRVSWAI